MTPKEAVLAARVWHWLRSRQRVGDVHTVAECAAHFGERCTNAMAQKAVEILCEFRLAEPLRARCCRVTHHEAVVWRAM